MNEGLYNKLLSSGGYSLPYLIRLWNDNYDFRFINDVRSLELEGKTYAASAFSFTPSDDGDSTLEIEVADNKIVSLIDSEDFFEAEFIGIVLEDGQVRPLRGWRKKYGNAKWNGKSATVTFPSDDRLTMTFPSLIFNSDNNRGNS